MGVGTKKMANSIVASSERSLSGIKSWPERVKSFYNDVRTEMRKVTTPSRKDVQATTSVVLIAVFLFGLYFWVIDNVIGRGVDFLFRTFAK
ncbi:MAG: SecE subunit of protein translocation complex [Acidobacteriaceae bacterium]|jgi:preprotein translocase subunit SecE|nr:SecE subunit of protein translocation complex [Acidobacteriaceae bacterium]